MKYAIAAIIGSILSILVVTSYTTKRIDVLQDRVATVELHQDALSDYLRTHAFDDAGFVHGVKAHAK